MDPEIMEMFSSLFFSLIAFVVLIFLSFIATQVLQAFFENRRKISESLLLKLIPQKDSNKISDQLKFDDAIDALIRNHHKHALLQATVQFWFSIAAAFLGFILIITSLFHATSTIWYENLINVIPGIVIEAVSVLFFTQSKETRQQSSDFLNRLRQDRQYEKSIAIANEIEDQQLKSKLKAEIALHLCGINKSPNNL